MWGWGVALKFVTENICRVLTLTPSALYELYWMTINAGLIADSCGLSLMMDHDDKFFFSSFMGLDAMLWIKLMAVENVARVVSGSFFSAPAVTYLSAASSRFALLLCFME